MWFYVDLSNAFMSIPLTAMGWVWSPYTITWIKPFFHYLIPLSLRSRILCSIHQSFTIIFQIYSNGYFYTFQFVHGKTLLCFKTFLRIAALNLLLEAKFEQRCLSFARHFFLITEPKKFSPSTTKKSFNDSEISLDTIMTKSYSISMIACDRWRVDMVSFLFSETWRPFLYRHSLLFCKLPYCYKTI